jgi:hypothetical protein
MFWRRGKSLAPARNQTTFHPPTAQSQNWLSYPNSQMLGNYICWNGKTLYFTQLTPTLNSKIIYKSNDRKFANQVFWECHLHGQFWGNVENYSYCSAEVWERNFHESVLDKTVCGPCGKEKYALYALSYWSMFVWTRKVEQWHSDIYLHTWYSWLDNLLDVILAS